MNESPKAAAAAAEKCFHGGLAARWGGFLHFRGGPAGRLGVWHVVVAVAGSLNPTLNPQTPRQPLPVSLQSPLIMSVKMQLRLFLWPHKGCAQGYHHAAHA